MPWYLGKCVGRSRGDTSEWQALSKLAGVSLELLKWGERKARESSALREDSECAGKGAQGNLGGLIGLT